MTPVALITGGSSGIGLATAALLIRHGFHAAISARDPVKLSHAARTLGPHCSTFPADLADPGEAERLVADVLARHTRLDAIVNNAGWSPAATIPQTTREIATQVFALNAIAPTLIISRAWETLVRQSEREGHGAVIVNVSSMATVDPFPMLYAYAAAKSAVNSLALSVARQGAPHHIRGFAVAPGAVETPLLRSLITPELLPASHTLQPSDVAQVIVDCITGKRDHDNGTTILVPSPRPG